MSVLYFFWAKLIQKQLYENGSSIDFCILPKIRNFATY